MSAPFKRILCWLGWCRKSEIGNWRTVWLDEYRLVRPRRCPHCKMGYYETDAGEKVAPPK